MKTRKVNGSSNLKIEYVRTALLKFMPNNPRIHTPEIIDKVTQLFKIHGVRSPLNVWRKNMTVYKGNLSLKAIKQLNMKLTPVIFHDFNNEAQAIAYSLSDNKSSEFADYDDEILSMLLRTKELDLTPKNTGFNSKEFKESKLSWEPDFNSIESIKENEDGLMTVIKIRCPFLLKEKVLEQLKIYMEEYEDVKIS